MLFKKEHDLAGIFLPLCFNLSVPFKSLPEKRGQQQQAASARILSLIPSEHLPVVEIIEQI